MNKKVKKDYGNNIYHMVNIETKLEIVGMLFNGSSHVREIARKLEVSHVLVSRRLKELLEGNVVDYDQNGKNQTYFLRKSVETRAYLIMFEKYKLLKILNKHHFLSSIVEGIQKDKRIKMALIFGSYAKSTEGKNSDVDIYIQTSDVKIKQEYSRIDSKLSIKIGKLGKDELSKEIAKNHVIIRGAEVYHENFFD